MICLFLQACDTNLEWGFGRLQREQKIVGRSKIARSSNNQHLSDKNNFFLKQHSNEQNNTFAHPYIDNSTKTDLLNKSITVESFKELRSIDDTTNTYDLLRNSETMADLSQTKESTHRKPTIQETKTSANHQLGSNIINLTKIEEYD